MPPAQAIYRNSAVLGVLDASFRGIGQIFFMNNPITGILLVAAFAFHNSWLALLLVLGSLGGTLAARLLKYQDGLVSSGMFSFNGGLLGLLTGVFLIPSAHPAGIFYAVAAGVVSAPAMNATVRIFSITLGVPALTVTFNLVGLSALLLGSATADGERRKAFSALFPRVLQSPETTLRATPAGDPVSFIVGICNGVFRGISEVFLIDSLWVGVVILVALAVCSRIAAVMALAGSLIGTLTAVALGADGNQIYLGLWGYNGALVAVALFGIVLEISWSSFIFTLLACSASSALYGALTQFLMPLGLIPLTLPMVIVVIGSALAARGSRLKPIPLVDYSTA
ncbi:urea transporter [Specibacter sp. NPDC057265]|uniref:urea transporter n=1 Tax=Specibacter sp. NPDC057265 TaxID=3346075 RepID=UPI003624FB52